MRGLASKGEEGGAKRVIRSVCGGCHNSCPINVEVEGNRVVRVSGVAGDPRTGGAICSKGYHIGFNGSRSTGWWLSRAAAALGARWQISDAVEYERTGRPVHDNDETLAVYPQIADMRMPNLGMHVDSRLHDETRIWEVDPIWECDRLPMSAR